SVGSAVVVALKGRLPLADADSRRADSAVVVGVGNHQMVHPEPGLELVPSPVPEPLCCEISVGSAVVVALKGRLPLADADSHGADSVVVVGVGVGVVVEEAESPFFFLPLAFGLGVASPIAHA
nr:hypothetical protein [Tanacetum cinerariifolium]